MNNLRSLLAVAFAVAAITALPAAASAQSPDDDPPGACAVPANVIFGSALPDFLPGTAANDEIWGFGDDDYLIGYGGDDRLHGGVGNDRVQGRHGGDRLGHDGRHGKPR